MRYALRTLAKSPGFTVVAVLTLALGIGANTTFLSVLYGVVLRGLPYPNASDLVEVRNVGKQGSTEGGISPAELRGYRARQRSLVGIGVYSVGRATLSRDDGAERVVQVRISANLFPLLGVQPIQGRNFLESEERDGDERVVIISHDFWQRYLGGATDVLGRHIRLNGTEHTVVGVMPVHFSGILPPNFSFSAGEPGVGFWKPLDLSSRGATDRTDRSLSTVARLAPGFSLRQANNDLVRVARELRSDQPADYPDAQWKLSVTSLRQSQFGLMFAPLGALMAAAAAVLLIACVNVSIMFLLRAAVRRRDIMIRLSIGASRRHIVGQLLAESSIVCALGAAGGMILAIAGIQVLKTHPPANIPRLQEVALDGPIALATVGVLLLVITAVGLAPALTLFKTRAVIDLAQTGRSTESRSAVRIRELLTIVEIALAVMLLIGGGLAFRSLNKLLHDDVGFAATRVFTFKTNLTAQAYPDLAHTNRFYEQLLGKFASIPGVVSVSAVSYLPLSGESQATSALPAFADQPSTVAWRVVRGPYFSALDVKLVNGRFFNDGDRADGPLVVIVDDSFARRFWPNVTAALGQPVRFGTGADAQTRVIVGIVHHVKHNGPGKNSLPEVYVPQAQFYQRGMYTVVEASNVVNLVPLVRARLAEIDPSIPMYFVETLEQRFSSAIALPRFTAGLVGAFSALALLLAGVGIFGVTGYSVAQRSREFGIRFALGAQRAHVAALVLGRTGRLALIGGTIGALAAFQIAGLMESLLYGVDPVDPPTLLVAATIIIATALLASLLPLSRALRVSPIDALRAE